jgi:nucleotide-binding universal stress UspA family protein
MKRVLIAVDGSVESTDAARVAYELFGSSAEYLVVTVADSGATLTGMMPLADASLAGAYVPPEIAQEAIDQAMKEAREAAAGAAAEVRGTETIIEVGDAGETIVRLAEEHDADLIVVGSHHRNWLSRLVAPSVRNHLVEHAPCPVLVVRGDRPS